MKTAIIVMSDPKGGEEATGRVFNALAAAYDFKQRDHEVAILFQGAGTRWIGELEKADHPAHELFVGVKDKVAGISCGCADVFGGAEEAEACGVDILKDNAVPGTTGLASLAALGEEGYTTLTF